MGNSNKSSLNKLKAFSYHDLEKATKKFRQENLIGKGHHGYFFKGWVDETTFAPTKPGKGMAVAIKKLIKYKEDEEEWLKEVNYLGQLHHENLVKLIGYCLKGKNRLLVYEFMPNGSLYDHLYTSNEPIPSATRAKIVIGVARGIAFLHSFKEHLIYLDLKPASILLDSDFNAKLSICGLTPELKMALGRYTPKSEVFSFGAVLLALLIGSRAFEDYVANSSENRREVFRIKEAWLGDLFSKEGAKVALALAFKCMSHEPEFRPPMVDVLVALEGLHSLETIPRTLQYGTESHATEPKWVLVSTDEAGEDINCEH